MELNVDDDEWKSYKNRGSPRCQTPQAQSEIQRQIDILLKNKIIQRSNAIYYSQVVLVPTNQMENGICVLITRN
jgi:hypothetical protein